MKTINSKSLMVFTILFVSIFAMPLVVNAQEKTTDDVFEINQVNPGIFGGFQEGFGALFGQNLGYGGKILESIFSMLFLQSLNLSSHEMLDNVFVLSANYSRTIMGDTYNFATENDQYELYWAPHEYNDIIPIETGAATTDQYGHAYCVVHKQGEYTYELEVGAAITLIIWDNDRSFITAVNKLINFFKMIIHQTEVLGRGISNELIKEGIALLTWFLIHINDIFTGDELFILNPITWQKLNIIPGPGFNITKEWYVTGDVAGDMNVNPGLDPKLEDIASGLGDNVLTAWDIMAQDRNDDYMEWLLKESLDEAIETVWTQFSFDLIQLWIKNFEIHIDVGAILEAMLGGGGGSPEVAIINAFNGCNIEFYLFTHHLAGAFLYNDTDSNRIISANYVPINVDGATVAVPQSTELTHRLILGSVGHYNFEKPTINPSNKSISWGLNVADVNITAVPLGVNLQSYSDAPEENLDYIYFGFTFEPKRDNQLGAAHGFLKLDQFFAPWNDPNTPYANSDIDNLDLAIIYVSTVLHFELDVQTQGQLLEEPTELLQQSHYKNTEHKLMVGNYIGGNAQDELEFIDIAGPDYEYGSESVRLTDPASTSIIPVLVWLMEHERHDTIVATGGTEVQSFSSDIRVQTEFNVMVWAVCYPEFNDGTGIWHDPTFSVYMIFESEGFWALIVLIAGVGLVGVATILIKRRKDSRF
ncbi:MAG: hypothetical protein ACW986_04570 [Promethearchaeota archaeon]|jgi:hypothetical protein